MGDLVRAPRDPLALGLRRPLQGEKGLALTEGASQQGDQTRRGRQEGAGTSAGPGRATRSVHWRPHPWGN